MQPTLFDIEEYEGDTEPCWVVQPEQGADMPAFDEEAQELYLSVCWELDRMTDSRNRWRKWALLLALVLAAHWLFLALAIVF